ncbi:MAG: hypothetical protein IH940_13355 [Acidobacteria bacterium]|nr:hypothetical protein [Acidobacteriota bacterium]
MESIDWRVVGAGALTAGVIAVPSAVLSRALGVDEDSALMPLFFGIILVGFILGGSLAARSARALPLTHAGLAALTTFMVVQTIGIVRRLLSGDGVEVAAMAFAGFLSLSAGILGGLVALRLRDRRN